MTKATRFERFDPWWSEMVKLVQNGQRVVVDDMEEAEARKLMQQMSSFRLTTQREHRQATSETTADHMQQLYMASCSVEVQRIRKENGRIDVVFVNRFDTPMMQRARAALAKAKAQPITAGVDHPRPSIPPIMMNPHLQLPGLQTADAPAAGGYDSSAASPENPVELPTSTAMEDLLASKFKL